MRQQRNRSLIFCRIALWLFAAFFTLLLASSFKSLETFASSDADIPVTSINHPYSNCLVLLKKGDSLQEFLEANPDYARVLACTSAGSRPVVMSVSFDTTPLEQHAAGLVSISGRVTPSEGYSISDELSFVSLAVWLYDPEDLQVLPIENYSHEALPGPLQQVYTTESTMEQLQSDLETDCGPQIQCRLEGGYILDSPLSWDLSETDMQQPGVYEALGMPLLPEGLQLPDSLAPFSCSVVVQEPGRFVLSPLTRYRSFPAFLWQEAVTPLEDKLTLWYSTGDGNWVADTAHDYLVYLKPGLLALYPAAFLPDVSYYLQVEYEGNFSNIMEIRFTDSDLIYNDIGGDRDGVDRLPQKIPEPSPVVSAGKETAGEDGADEKTDGKDESSGSLSDDTLSASHPILPETADPPPQPSNDTSAADAAEIEQPGEEKTSRLDISATEPVSQTERTEAAPAPEKTSSPLWLLLPTGSAMLLGIILFLYERRKHYDER